MQSLENYQVLKSAWNLLRLTFGIVPIVSGLDKFTNLLTQWDKYLNPVIAEMLPFSIHTFMIIIGVIEIASGILVLVKPIIGGYIGAIWLTLIALTIFASGNYLDTAIRDLVMAVGAFSLARISVLVKT